MKKYLKYLLLPLFLIFLTACDSHSEKEDTTQNMKTSVSTVILKDFNGKEVRLKEFKGKKVYINVWASWCGPCQSEMPELEELYQSLKNDDSIVFISVTSPNNKEFANSNPADKDSQTIKETAEQLGVTYPIYGDTKDSFVNTFGIQAFPTHLFINTDGSIHGQFSGAMTKEKLEQVFNNWK